MTIVAIATISLTITCGVMAILTSSESWRAASLAILCVGALISELLRRKTT
ncbi:MAG: hypothetical protein KA165_17560 [Saprospiraceae bacterium]|nr:hypothetical protein [Saprospiraceae bacterium]